MEKLPTFIFLSLQLIQAAWVRARVPVLREGSRCVCRRLWRLWWSISLPGSIEDNFRISVLYA